MKKAFTTLLALTLFSAAATDAAAITILNQTEGFLNSTKNGVATAHLGTTQLSYNATGVDKLVVAYATEAGFNNQKVTSVTLTYNGIPMTLAKQDNFAPPGVAPFTGDGGYAGIFYLDNPFQGAANFGITAGTTGGAPNGGHVSILGLVGTADGLGASNATWTSLTAAGNVSTSLTTTGNNSLILAMVENSGANNGAGTPNVVTPLSLSNNGSWGNNWGGAATGTQFVAASGTTLTPTFSTNIGFSIHVVAVEFLDAAPAVIPEPATATLGLLALGGLMMSRRRTPAAA